MHWKMRPLMPTYGDLVNRYVMYFSLKFYGLNVIDCPDFRGVSGICYIFTDYTYFSSYTNDSDLRDFQPELCVRTLTSKIF